MLGFAIVATIAFVYTESKVHNPIIPLNILAMRGTYLAVLASISVGIAMFGASVFLAQYYQLGRGMSPTMSGLMLTPMMVGVLISSLFIGRLVSKLGIWKPFVVAGAVLLTAGAFVFSTITATTSLWLIGAYGVVTGFGVGMLMQNLVLAVQNSIAVSDVGAATGTVTFFRALGGAVGIQALGFVFERRMNSLVTSGLPDVIKQAAIADATANPAAAQICAAAAVDPTQIAQAAAQCPQTAAIFSDLSTLQASHGGTMDMSVFHSDAFVTLLRTSIADSIGRLFLIAGVIAAVALIPVLLMKSTKLRTHFDDALPDDKPVAREAVDQ